MALLCSDRGRDVIVNFSTIGMAVLSILPVQSKKRDENIRIFFVETSGRFCPTFRQLCAVESAARINPKASITVYTEKNQIVNQSTDDNRQEKKVPNWATISNLLRQMVNVQIVREDLLRHLEGTPLEKIHRNGLLNQSASPVIHRSDAIRIALLWKNGGIYLDLDCMVMHPLDGLKNTVGTVRDSITNWVENGVMAFDARHPFLHYLMKSMILAFRPEFDMSLGPSLLSDALLDFCDRQDLPANKWLPCWRNSSIIIQPPDAFYAINSGRADAFFRPDIDPADWNKLANSLISHIYDSGSGRPVPSSSLYAKLARKYCPITYAMATDTGTSQF